jgi:two-component system LytT family sensor kinase
VAGINLKTDLLIAFPFKQNRFAVFLFHWIAWLLLHFITFLPTLVNSKITYWEPFVFTHIVLVSINFLLFYIAGFFIIPSMAVLHKRWIWVLVGSLLAAIVFTYLKFRLEYFHNNYLLDHTHFFQNKPAKKPAVESMGVFSYRFRTYFQTNILVNISVIVVAFAYRLLLSWFQQEKIRKDLEYQKLRTELSFLKMQVNPHFLFNALNNIYSLAVIENSNRTGNSILRLSELMRYMLYEKEDAENKVSLDKEILHINSYIDLERLRRPGDMYVNFSIEGEVDGKRIAPLLIFPLIENAFKHGILSDKIKPVTIDLKIGEKQIEFCIENFTNNYQKDIVGGIGVQNVKKRLDLLYGENYHLDIKDDGHKFTVKLLLPL